jgi:hypothetical protein
LGKKQEVLEYEFITLIPLEKNIGKSCIQTSLALMARKSVKSSSISKHVPMIHRLHISNLRKKNGGIASMVGLSID